MINPYAIGHTLGRELLLENQELLQEEDTDTGENWTPSAIAHAAFENYQQFSPWEFTASEFNSSEDPDGAWDAFEQGLSAGAEEAARELEVTA